MSDLDFTPVALDYERPAESESLASSRTFLKP